MSVDAPAISWTDVMSGRSSGQPLAIGTVVVGRRADAGLILLDEHVSEHNAELHWDGDRLRIRDLGSRTGTTVNRWPISDWTDLSHGDTISLGGFEVVVELNPAAGRPTSLTPSGSTTQKSRAGKSGVRHCCARSRTAGSCCSS